MQAVKLKMCLGLHIAAKHYHVSLMVRGLLAVSHTRGLKKESEKRKNKHKNGKTLKTKESVSKMKDAY